MSKDTDINLRNKVIYSIYIRNHTQEGTFKSIENDLLRIKNLGTDIIWFMPIHSIGILNKKGELGCPYSNKSYRDVNPEYGTMEDFIHLVEEIHKLNMKCIIDVVYNHTSHDSDLFKEHPEYFYRNIDGCVGNRVGDWSDIIDLDYSNYNLWNYQIESLKQWSNIVDGFRCDVASLIPIEFWKKAKEETSKIKKDLIWLAESIDLSFIKEMRRLDFDVWSDSELYQVFDIIYDYDTWDVYCDFLRGKIQLSEYISLLNFQDGIYPTNYVKLRCLENHDRPRISSLVNGKNVLENFTSFLYFQKGATLIYAGQEFENKHTPSLFDIDKIYRKDDASIGVLMKRLYQIKKDELFTIGDYKLKAIDKSSTVIGYYEKNDESIVGIFNLKGISENVSVNLDDGIYINQINDEKILVTSNTISTTGYPIIIKK